MRNPPRSSNRGAQPIAVLYEDDRYVVFDKPAGLLVIATPRKERNTLVQRVNERFADDGSWKLHPCHRLDRDTSGAIIFAKGKRNQQAMMTAFRNKAVKKKYIAFVHGVLKEKQGTFDRPVRHRELEAYGRGRRPKSATTKYKVIKQKRHYCVVEVEPVTGRTNQIRIHFSQHGHPLVGERKYAFARDYALKFRRAALHSSSVEWSDPLTHKTVQIQSNLPKDMEVFLARN